MQPSSHSITLWIEQLRASDLAAARELWQRFFARKVVVARQRLAPGSRRVADEEDAALSAFLAFQRGSQQVRFPNLANRDELWNILFTLTTRAAAGQFRSEEGKLFTLLASQRQERGREGLEQGVPALEALCGSLMEGDVEAVNALAFLVNPKER
jgi:hypothetical protein